MKDEQSGGEGHFIRFIPAADSLQIFKSLKNNSLFTGRGFTVCTFCKRTKLRSRVELIKQEKSVFTATPCGLHY